jgi:hypothetical protein
MRVRTHRYQERTSVRKAAAGPPDCVGATLMVAHDRVVRDKAAGPHEELPSFGPATEG